MITLKNDRLCFSFPEIDEVILRFIEQHINSTLPAIIAADRSFAVQALQSSWQFREATPEGRRRYWRIYSDSDSEISEDEGRFQVLTASFSVS